VPKQQLYWHTSANMSINVVKMPAVGSYLCSNGKTRQCKKRPKNVLLQAFGAAKRKIIVFIYAFNDDDIAEALVDAAERGVRVQVFVDYEQSIEQQTRDAFPDELPLRLDLFRCYTSDSDRDRYIKPMHLKLAYVDNYEIAGSFNYTNAATRYNTEILVVSKRRPEQVISDIKFIHKSIVIVGRL